MDFGTKSVEVDSKKRKMTHFSDEVGVFLFVLGKRDSVFPEIITGTFVGFASVFQLGDRRFLILLLSKVL